MTSTGKRTLWNIHRQGGKNTTAAALGLHTALYRPKSLVLLVSPSLRQSGELVRKVADLADRLEHPPELDEDNRLSLSVQGGGRVVSLPGAEATIRGFSAATLVIEDEAARAPDDLYRAVRPMMAVSGGRLILMSTPFGKRGHFHAEWSEGGPVWERAAVKATECSRILARVPGRGAEVARADLVHVGGACASSHGDHRPPCSANEHRHGAHSAEVKPSSEAAQ
jgi:hypothetical protein